eukprot:CAMPEP_0183458836 /NCGR_PEP_ID=MMETSP0370-20130417/134341_1 /TAXON_ID=268820 /ORGANISM="Peridinium aciculiferum, Strain PAER-2" /LENGTH=42 /DNA_ID= /DNA_START= /DNA_END= /DNA_ORIENTATION=
MTWPSCTPQPSVSWRPTHSPLANFTSPMYFTAARLAFQVTGC